MKVDTAQNRSPHSFRNKAARVLWAFARALLYRPSPKICHGWRRFLLRLFGATIGRSAHVYPSTKIWAPWNLTMGDYSCLAGDVDCYCVDRIVLDAHSTVSQYSFLCGATHDYEHPAMPLIAAPIVIGEGAWVAADVFVAPGVTIGEGAVVGARSSVFKDVEPWSVVAGNPARFLKRRKLASNSEPVHPATQAHQAA